MEKKVKRMELRPLKEDDPSDSIVRLSTDGTQPVELAKTGSPSAQTPTILEAAPSFGDRVKRQGSFDELAQGVNPQVLSEEDGWAQSSPPRGVPWGWVALAGIVFVAAIGWSVRQVSLAESSGPKAQAAAEQLLQTDAEEVIEAEQVVANIEQAVAAYCAAASIDELLPWVRHPDRVRPLMQDYYQRNPLVPPGFKRMVRVLRPHTFSLRAEFWEASIETDSGGEESLLLQTESDLQAKIDWETAVGYQPIAWDDYARDRPEGSSMDFRVFLEQDFFYSHEFANSENWLCLRLTARDGDAVVFGYARYDSEVALTIAQLLHDQQGRAAAILRLFIPKDLKSRNGVVIEKMVAPRWIYLDSPISES